MTVNSPQLHAVRVLTKAANAESLAPQVVAQQPPAFQAGEALVRVRSAGGQSQRCQSGFGLDASGCFSAHAWT